MNNHGCMSKRELKWSLVLIGNSHHLWVFSAKLVDLLVNEGAEGNPGFVEM